MDGVGLTPPFPPRGAPILARSRSRASRDFDRFPAKTHPDRDPDRDPDPSDFERPSIDRLVDRAVELVLDALPPNERDASRVHVRRRLLTDAFGLHSDDVARLEGVSDAAVRQSRSKAERALTLARERGFSNPFADSNP